jgi:hypothetical protein
MNSQKNLENQIDSIRSSEVNPDDARDKKCAPGKMFENGSCIPLNVLVEMASAYNAENPDDSIKLYPSFEALNRGKYKRYLLKEFKRRMGAVCKSQNCWTKQSFINRMKKSLKDELQKMTFRPEGPQGKFEWLNTLNINDVVLQYEDKYKDFKFLGAVPIDFDELPALGIKNLDLSNLVKLGKVKIGIIFNLDESYKSGSHWVASFANLQEGRVLYYDSYAIPPEPRIRKYMRKIANFCKEDMKVNEIVAEHNKIRHQFGGSECGVYSINFILRLLRGDTFEEICNSKTPDNTINQCRRVYFK